ADGGRGGEKDATVDVRRVGGGAGDEGLVGQASEGAADLGLADLAGNALLEFHGLFVADGFDLLRELALHFRGARTLFLRIAEDAEPLEAGAADEVEKVLEFLLGLAGKADDEGGAQGDAGDAGAD